MKLPAVALGLAISIPLANAYTGDLTHYSPSTGSCGVVSQESDAIVALSHFIMSSYTGTNPNNNPICNKQISIHNPTTGTNTIATVIDTCEGCAYGDIDATISLFDTIAPTGDGRVHGIQWTPIGWTVPGDSSQSSVSSAVQPSSSAAAAAAVPSLAVPLEEKVAAVVPSPATTAPPTESSTIPAAPSTMTALSPSIAPALPSTVSSSTVQQPSSTATASCPTARESVCSADGSQIGTCTMELTVELGPVAMGTKCVGGYMVMANSRLRSRRG